ncbi:MAG: transglutaminase domain-containing protein [Planctomycetia bacterium]|nr:transglutaminase domain-containing protein [Planctomycetia bacterium]
MQRLRLALLLFCCLAAPALAVDPKEDTNNGPTLGDETVQHIQLGLTVESQGGECRGIHGTTPIPIEWPEQSVRVVAEDITPNVAQVDYRMVAGTVQQMVIDVPFVAPLEKVNALVTMEVTKRKLIAPTDTAQYTLPNKKKLPPDVRIYLGPSPKIESRHAKIRSTAKEILKDKRDASAWEQVEAIYDGVRERVEYKNGPIKGALAALKDGDGDCEELTSLFIAICRAEDIPARTVWVPGHCYPEFYLWDATETGYWFPCQAAGDRAFGEIDEQRPILQKGDNFRDPDRPKQQLRYLSEFLTGKGGKPKVKFVREIVDGPGAN